MPRPRLRRELCDCRDCVDGLAVQPLADEKHAAALLDPPPKCVVLFGSSFLALPTEGIVDDGITQATEPHSAAQGQPADSLDAAVCPHLDRLAQDGCSGFVAMHATAGARALVFVSSAEGSLHGHRKQTLRICVVQGCHRVGSKPFNNCLVTAPAPNRHSLALQTGARHLLAQASTLVLCIGKACCRPLRHAQPRHHAGSNSCTLCLFPTTTRPRQQDRPWASCEHCD